MSHSISVLMSLYHKENPEWFTSCMDSILFQTVQPAEIVLVEDGQLPAELEVVVRSYETTCKLLKVIRFDKNRGLGIALKYGLGCCSYDLVARMDTDDIALPNRFEKQLRVFSEHPEIDVCSAWVNEFIGTTDNVIAVKTLPETAEEIYAYGKSRNPINHPVTMFRKSAVLAAGNYQHSPLSEDYWLWARMLVNGSKFYNIQEPLLYFRASDDMYSRRGGGGYLKNEISLLKRLYSIGYINVVQLIKSVFIRSIVRIVPNSLRAYIYQKLLRSHSPD